MKDILYSTDAYKLSHRTAYPKGTTKIQSNWVARSDKFSKTQHNGVIHFGITNFVYELQQWEKWFFGMTKNEMWEYICKYGDTVNAILGTDDYQISQWYDLYKLGYLPIKICSATEGVLHRLQTPLVTVENTHPDFFWLVNYLETTLSASLWLPSTSATIANEMHNILDRFYEQTGANKAMIPYACHDFSYRGMGGDEAAMLSGLGHLNSFSGSDTLPAIKRYKELYGEHKGNSVNATEHSVMTVNGIDGEYETFKTLIDSNPNGILSIVSDGYDYFNVLTDTLPKLKNKIMARGDGSKLVIRPDCYSEDTSILTPRGWVLFKELTKNDLVAQVLDDGSYEFVKPLKYIEQNYVGEMHNFKDNFGKVDMLVTPNHRMLVQQQNKKTKEFKEKIIFAEDMPKKGYHGQKMFRSAKAKCNGLVLTPIERLKIAFQADGSFSTTGSRIRFGLQKQRKIDRIEEICNNANLEFKTYKLSDGRVEVNIKVDINDFKKDFNWVDISNLDGNWCEEFIEELSYWDATRRNEGRIKFDTTTKEVLDVVELIALSAGYGCLISKSEDNRKEHFSSVYTAHILKDNGIGGQSWVNDVVHYNGKVYCVTVPTGKLLVKRNKSTLVCGNSGVPIDIICGEPIDKSSEPIFFDTSEWSRKYYPDFDAIKKEIGENLEYHVSGNTPHGEYGDNEITGRFNFEGKNYEMTIEIEWNRYDKQYYYTDGHSIKSCEEIEIVEPTLTPEQKGSLELLGETFGYTINDKGYKVLNEKIGLIYGDGMTIESITAILTRMEQQGWSAENIVFGVGSFTYQYNTRDTYGFAFKATYAEVNGEKRDIFKQPKTDSGKNSLKGYFELPHVVYMDGKNGAELAEQTMQHLGNLGE